MTDSTPPYNVPEQFGFILRQVSQRYAAIFAAAMQDDITGPQFSAIATLLFNGPCSQNQLGRMVATDAPTIKGVVDRLHKRGLVRTGTDPTDGRMVIISLTPEGEAKARASIEAVRHVGDTALAPLSEAERAVFIAMLRRLR